ncbi:hypothetical protein [Amycolatopsis sp. SID8362]|uniref:hypothetical protein n=1 Tax=Amycolatopsis sp. SID8362 TaxID=2690346 RepID=UPI0028149F6C|nr:hypothetical protein [Amycolatopsis sp. SID8362]
MIPVRQARRRLLGVLAAAAFVTAACGSDSQAETVHAGREIRGQLELLRLVVTADRDSVPPSPSLSVTIRDTIDELGSVGKDVGKLPDDQARAAFTSITDRAVGLAHQLDDGIGDGTDAGLDRIDAQLQGLVAELGRWGVTA